MKTFLAIDFGTSQSSVAVLKENSKQPPEIIELNDGQRVVKAIDTAMQLDGNGNIAYFGAKAHEKANEDPEHTFQNFKVFIGSNGDAYQNETEQNKYSPENLALIFLTHLREVIEEKYFNATKLSEMEDLSCVIGCPAEWTEFQKATLKDIALKAGFPGIKLCDEPVGAIYYNYFFGGLKLNKTQNILVYDFGGGTTDVAIAKVSVSDTGRLEPSILSVGGLPELGGKDFDETLVTNYANENGYDIQSLPSRDRIHDHWVIGLVARRVKEELSEKDFTEKTINRLKAANEAKPKKFSLTRDGFEGICKGLIDRFDEPIYDALTSAGLSPEDIDYVILAGGSSAMPFVKNRMSGIFAANKIIMSPSTDVIAQGLALYGRTEAVGTTPFVFDTAKSESTPNRQQQQTVYAQQVAVAAAASQQSAPKSHKGLFLTVAAVVLLAFGGYIYVQNQTAKERAVLEAQQEQARKEQERLRAERERAEQERQRAERERQQAERARIEAEKKAREAQSRRTLTRGAILDILKSYDFTYTGILGSGAITSFIWFEKDEEFLGSDGGLLSDIHVWFTNKGIYWDSLGLWRYKYTFPRIHGVSIGSGTVPNSKISYEQLRSANGPSRSDLEKMFGHIPGYKKIVAAILEIKNY